MDSPAGFMASITSSTTSDINQIYAISCCCTSASSWRPYTILGWRTSFFWLFSVIRNVIEKVVDLARQINLEVDSDDVQKLLDSNNQRLTGS
ncbi:hypothetical protein TNCV_4765531 [Trichonephila clavipes]|nr:hypothetical protein TNCV_4765531 [Trichonephila clavipes]